MVLQGRKNLHLERSDEIYSKWNFIEYGSSY